MAIAYRSSSTPQSGAGVTSLTMPVPAGVTSGDLLVITLGFEGVAAGSGPWVLPTDVAGHLHPNRGWKQIGFQAPSGTGNGLEIWAGIFTTGTQTVCDFVASDSAVGVESAWSGSYAPNGNITDGAVRAATFAQVTGNNPAAPSIYTYTNELVIACGADQLSAPGYGTPTLTGWTFHSRTDAARGGVAGNVEGVEADATTPFEGNSGAIQFTATAASGGVGATATLAVRPSTAPPASTNPALAMLFPSA